MSGPCPHCPPDDCGHTYCAEHGRWYLAHCWGCDEDRRADLALERLREQRTERTREGER